MKLYLYYFLSNAATVVLPGGPSDPVVPDQALVHGLRETEPDHALCDARPGFRVLRKEREKCLSTYAGLPM